MFSREEKHAQRHCLCYKCDQLIEDQEENLHILSVSGRGYGSNFDSCRFSIQLCDICMNREYIKWFHETPVMDGYVENYQYEEKIQELIESFILENREYVWNGKDNYHMKRQDWIDMEKGVLTDEKYEEYGMYSPRQIKAYEERFPTCHHPVNIVYENQSRSSECPFGAYGEYNQEASEHTCEECFSCEHYQQRETPIKEMKEEEFEEYKSYLVGKTNYEKYKDQFED